MVGIGNSVATILVIGATGNTGKHVVRQLLDQGQPVQVIVRSKQRMFDVLPISTQARNQGDHDLLSIKEGSLLDMTSYDIENSVRDAKAVICCLGHSMDFNGIFGDPKHLVSDSVKKVTDALLKTSGQSIVHSVPKKFILMSSAGVDHPDATDDRRSWIDRSMLYLIRRLIPPHSDNEEAGLVLHRIGKASTIDWVAVRPTNLVNNDNNTDYVIFDKPNGSLFGNTQVSRQNVAKFMVNLINQDDLWQKWKFQYPVIYDAEVGPEADSTKDL